MVVFIPFHWVFEGGEERKKEKQKGKRERSWKIKCLLFALLKTVNSRVTSKFCSAVLPIVHTSTSTYLSTSLARHCTYFWAAQNITIAWAALTQVEVFTLPHIF